MNLSAANPGKEKLWAGLDVLPRRTLAWLALTPGWPAELARMGFPAGMKGTWADGASVTEALKEPCAQGFVTALPPATPWEEPIYILPDANRRSALRAFAQDPEFGPNYLTRELAECARTMSKAGGRLLEYDPNLSRWAALAQWAGPEDEELAGFFDQRVAEAFAKANPDQWSIPDVSRWIDAAQPIAGVLGGRLPIAIGRAQRRLELYHRRAQDKQALHHYLERKEQDAAIDALLEDDGHWALHFAGEGGVGKTMLLRHLVTEIADRKGLAVSRVDFDYLNPDYPKRAPGLLLLALAEEFRLQAGPDMETYFLRFDKIVDRIHRQIAGAQGPQIEQVVAPGSKDVDEMIGTFVDALRKLAENRQPVLILDTCEELAKVHPDGTIPDNVAVTFAFLDQIHEAYKKVRVIFAGRRPLAKQGYGWTADSPLKEQPHLRLHVIEHFTGRQAEEFLGAYSELVHDRAVPFPQPLEADVMRLSPAGESATRSRFRITGEPQPAAVPRFNAYDLAMYAAWACQDPDLTPVKMEKEGRYYYVRERIVTRAGDFIRPFIPILAICGRFDRPLVDALLGATFHGNPAAGPQAEPSRAVTDLDWVQPDRAAGAGMWRIESQLQDRLLDYYRDQESAAYQAAAERVRQVLFEETLKRPFPQLTPQYFIVALKVSAAEPESAAAWWAAVENRFLAQNAWPWADNLVAVLAAHPVLDPQTGVPLRAAVQATRAAAYLHLNGRPSEELWTDVAANAPRHPVVADRRRLLTRAALARDDLEAGRSALATGDPQLFAALTAALERRIERAELLTTKEDPNQVLGLFAGAPLDRGCRSFVLCLFGRSLDRFGSLDEARDAFHAALSGAQSTITPSLDWLPPEDLWGRIQLERLRTAVGIPPEEAAQLAASPPLTKPSGIDADRLLAGLLLMHKVGTVNPESCRPFVAKPPKCNAHRYFPPALVAAQIRAAIDGEPLQAEKELTATMATVTGSPELVLPIERAILQIRWRNRLANASIPPVIQQSAFLGDGRLVALYRYMFVDSTPAHIPAELRPMEEWSMASPDGAAQIVEAFMFGSIENPNWPGSLITAIEEYSDTGDHLGVMLLACTGMLRHVAKGDYVSASRGLDLLRSHYSSCPGLPGWDSVETAVQTGRFTDLLDSTKADWRPAVARVLAATHGIRFPKRVPSDLVAWIRKNYAAEVPGGRRIPTELVFLATQDREPPAAAPAIAIASESTPRRSAARVVVDSALRAVKPLLPSQDKVISGVFQVLAAAVLIGVYWLWAAFLHLIGIRLGIFFNILLLLAVVALGAQVPKVAKKLFSLYFRLCEADAIFEPASVPGNPNLPMEVPGMVRQRLAFGGIPLFRNDFPYLAATELRYSRLTEQMLPKPNPQRMQQLKKRVFFFGNVLDVRIAVDSYTAAAPWEALLYLPSHESLLADSLFRIRRSVQRRQPRPTQPPMEGSLVMAIYTGVPETVAARRRAYGAVRTSKAPLIPHIGPPGTVTLPAIDLAVFYAVPFASASALALKVEAIEPIGEQSKYLSESIADTSESLLTAADIAARYPNLRVCIIQSPPVTIGSRVASDRREAALLRRFGAELFATGIPMVLTLPSGAEQAPVANWQAFIDSWAPKGGPRNTSRHMVETVYQMQQSLAKLQLPDTEAATEIALDICLYIDERVDMRVNSMPSATRAAATTDAPSAGTVRPASKPD
jgi:hypothetical protein